MFVFLFLPRLTVIPTSLHNIVLPQLVRLARTVSARANPSFRVVQWPMRFGNIWDKCSITHYERIWEIDVYRDRKMDLFGMHIHTVLGMHHFTARFVLMSLCVTQDCQSVLLIRFLQFPIYAKRSSVSHCHLSNISFLYQCLLSYS